MKQSGFLSLLVCVSFFLNIYGTVESIPLSKVFGYLGSTFSFALDIYGFIDSLDDDDKTPTDDKNMEEYKKMEELKKELSDRIDASTMSIKAKIDLHGRSDRLLEIVKYTSALLTDIEHIMESTDTKTRDENIRRFKSGFKEYEADIQEISRLLTVEIPVKGLSKSLIDMFAEQVDCSLTSLREFEDDYMNILSNAIAIDLANERFNDIDLSNQTIAFWTENVEILKEEFKLRRQKCIALFSQLVKDDLEGNENATDLQRKNTLRYSDKSNVIVFVTNVTGWDFKYLEKDNYSFRNTSSEKTKFSFFERKIKTVETLDLNSTRTEENYTKVVPSDEDISMLVSRLNNRTCDMKTFGETIDDMLFWRGITLRFRLIMNQNTTNEIAIDLSSRRINHFQACDKDIVIAVEEMKAENASSIVYKTMSTDGDNAEGDTCGVAIVTVSTTTMMFYLVIRYLLGYTL